MGKSRHKPEYRRAYYLAHKGVARDQQLRRDYGITQDDYLRILAYQHKKCAICRRHMDGHLKGKFLQVDRDHKTNRVRGLLCPNCNKALGLLQDCEQFAIHLLQYLATPPAQAVLKGGTP